jgi:hypothetical protein
VTASITTEVLHKYLTNPAKYKVLCYCFDLYTICAKYTKKILGTTMRDILDIIRNIDDLYENNTSLSVLKDFERVLSEMDMYVYENWEDGELAYGPQVDRHWITAGFMWPKDKMPNPTAAQRLLDLGCKVKYEKTHLLEPRKIRTPEDIRPGTKKGKLDRNPVWIVEIAMPKKIAFDMYKGYMDRMKNETQQGKSPSPGTPAPGGAPAPTAPPPAAGGMPPAGGAPAPAV